jgi:hypothetical protein
MAFASNKYASQNCFFWFDFCFKIGIFVYPHYTVRLPGNNDTGDEVGNRGAGSQEGQPHHLATFSVH